MNIAPMFVLEGPDGVGKSSIARNLIELLETHGRRAIHLSLPGRTNGTLGELVYKIHHHDLTPDIPVYDPTALQLLHLAAHAEAITSEILPARQQGVIVILDRYWWSLAVYGTDMNMDTTALNGAIEIEKSLWAKCLPSCIFLITRHQSPSYDPGKSANLLYRYKTLVRTEKECDIESLENISPSGSAQYIYDYIESNIDLGRHDEEKGEVH